MYNVVKRFLEKLRQAKEQGRLIQFIKNISEADMYKPDGLVSELARELRNNVKPTQLRKFFFLLKQVKEKIRGKEDYTREVLKIYPLLHYAVARGVINKDFAELLTFLLEAGEEDREAMEKVIYFIESFVAYHKYFSSLRGDRGGPAKAKS